MSQTLSAQPGAIHHIELWVPDLARAVPSWEWLLGEFGYRRHQEFPGGISWKLQTIGTNHNHDHYIVLEESPDMLDVSHNRHRPGLNHLAFHAGSREMVDRLAADSSEHGWTLLFADRHPFAGGPDHYAAYFSDRDGFEVELVADPLNDRSMISMK